MRGQLSFVGLLQSRFCYFTLPQCDSSIYYFTLLHSCCRPAAVLFRLNRCSSSFSQLALLRRLLFPFLFLSPHLFNPTALILTAYIGSFFFFLSHGGMDFHKLGCFWLFCSRGVFFLRNDEQNHMIFYCMFCCCFHHSCVFTRVKSSVTGIGHRVSIVNFPSTISSAVNNIQFKCLRSSPVGSAGAE